MLQISEKIRQKKRRFWNNYQHFMKRGYTQLFIKKKAVTLRQRPLTTNF